MNEFSGTVSIDNIISQINEAENRAAQLKQLLRNEKIVAVQDINRQIENKKAVIAKFNAELETLKAKLKQLNDLTPEEDGPELEREAVKKETETRKDNNKSLNDLIEKIRTQAGGSVKSGKTSLWPDGNVTMYTLEDIIPGKLSEAFAKFKTKQ